MLQSDRGAVGSDLNQPAFQRAHPTVHPILEHSLLAALAYQQGLESNLRNLSIGEGFLYFALNVSGESFGVTVNALPKRASTLRIYQAVKVGLETLSERLSSELVTRKFTPYLQERGRELGVFHFARTKETRELGEDSQKFYEQLRDAYLTGIEFGCSYVFYRLLYSLTNSLDLPKPRFARSKGDKSDIALLEEEVAGLITPHVAALQRTLSRHSVNILSLCQAYGVGWYDTRKLLHKPYAFGELSGFLRSFSPYPSARSLVRAKRAVSTWQKKGISNLTEADRHLFEVLNADIVEAESLYCIFKYFAKSSLPVSISPRQIQVMSYELRHMGYLAQRYTDSFLRRTFISHGGDTERVKYTVANLEFAYQQVTKICQQFPALSTKGLMSWMQTALASRSTFSMEPSQFRLQFETHKVLEEYRKYSENNRRRLESSSQYHKPLYPLSWIAQKLQPCLESSLQSLQRRISSLTDDDYRRWVNEELAPAALQRVEEKLFALKNNDRDGYHRLLRDITALNRIRSFLRKERKGDSSTPSGLSNKLCSDMLKAMMGTEVQGELTEQQKMFRERIHEQRYIARYARFCEVSRSFAKIDTSQGGTFLDLFQVSAIHPLRGLLHTFTISAPRAQHRLPGMTYFIPPAYGEKLDCPRNLSMLTSYVIHLGLWYARYNHLESGINMLTRQEKEYRHEKMMHYAMVGISALQELLREEVKQANSSPKITSDRVLEYIHRSVYALRQEESGHLYSIRTYTEEGRDRNFMGSRRYEPTADQETPEIYEVSKRCIERVTREELETLGRLKGNQRIPGDRFLPKRSNFIVDNQALENFKRAALYWLGDGISTTPFSLEDQLLVECAVDDIGSISTEQFQTYIALAQLILVSELIDRQ